MTKGDRERTLKMHPPQSDGIPKPKSLREVPGYISRVVRGFTFRLFYIVKLVWETAPHLLILMCLMCVFEGVLPVIGAYISKDILNAIADFIGVENLGSVGENIFNTLRPLFVLFLAYFIYLFVSKILTKVSGIVSAMAGELVVNHIKMKIIEKSKSVDIPSFDRPEFYEKLENANREASMRPIGILSATFRVISSLISAVSFVTVLATLSPIAPIMIVAAAAPGAIVNFSYRRKSFGYIRRHSKERREMNYYSGVMVNKDLVKEIRILGLGDTFSEKYKQSFTKYYKGMKKLILKEGFDQIIVGFISTVINCLLFGYIAYNVIYGERQIGDWSLYTGALSSISGAVTAILTATATIYEGTLFIENMITFMNEEVKIKPMLNEPLLPKKGVGHTVEFKNVSFAYPGTDKYVLKNINLTMNPGESVVLVGLNGAGKTTLIKLLTRLYDPTEGQILLDGRDLRDYEPKALYDMFGIIFQDFGKYAVSASENIKFGDIDGEHSESDVREAAEHGGAHGFIEELPLGYETPLTRMFEDDGIELSGGQWQKLSVSRAFYKSSEILILDEPTAALDAIAEQEVFNRFTELSHEKTTVFVSHRLSSATTADKIIVLDAGTVAEVGTHRELMEQGGKYYRLFSTQAKRYTDSYEED